MKTNIGDGRKIFVNNRDLTNVLVVEEDVNQKPLGLYEDDLPELQNPGETPDAVNGKQLGERIET